MAAYGFQSCALSVGSNSLGRMTNDHTPCMSSSVSARAVGDVTSCFELASVLLLDPYASSLGRCAWCVRSLGTGAQRERERERKQNKLADMEPAGHRLFGFVSSLDTRSPSHVFV